MSSDSAHRLPTNFTEDAAQSCQAGSEVLNPFTTVRDFGVGPHPIGLLLLTPTLSHIQVVEALEHLPDGEARRMMWIERGHARSEVPHSEELIDELVELQPIDGLIVILGGLRLRMFLGQTDDIDLYEHGVLDCFPEVVGRSLHLSVARYPLMQALCDFLDWQSGWAETNDVVYRLEHEAVIAGDFWPSLWNRLEGAADTVSLPKQVDAISAEIERIRRREEDLEG